MTPFLTHPLRSLAALIALGAAMPLAAQSAPGGFSLPQPTPTPTPAPAGPADERAGVAIPPRSVAPVPRITPAPVPTDAATPSPASPGPRPTQPAPGAVATPPPAPRATVPAPAATPLAPPPERLGFPALEQPAQTPVPTPSAPAAAPVTPPSFAPSEPLGAPAFDWRWLAAGGTLLASLLGALLLRRQTKPAVLRLAKAPETPDASAEPLLPRIDLTLDILGATRSLRMFTLRYRLTLANRSERAVNDLAVAVQLTCAKRGASNAVPTTAAQDALPLARIGPHQSRTISGEVQLPLADITPVMQGQTPLFIPLLHVTIEGESQQALAKSFVIGMPSGAEGRVQPIVMAGAPGALPKLKARAIDPAPTV